ncbi:MAG: deoxyguanosinetriphosphate triphosphohydrolase [Gammaproteobacteria bacterium]|nr:deoxyguanosinetriphosphate triphosphohydrolase [Gammaproteobacteria bacterium]
MTNLAKYAVTEHNSKGRLVFESAPRYRSQTQRDRDRVIHSGAFRRLEYKTQVFVNHEGDMFRTRLTHSIEVAQIGRSIARVMKLNEDLVEAICLAHDLGHTPFGHAGQDALNSCMKNYGGFEHNLQSLRVVDQLEERYAEFSGLNLTFEAREGILKHCSKSVAEKLGELGQRFLQNSQPSLEAQVANLADAIAYNNHDLDDGLRAGLIEMDPLREEPLFAIHFDEVSKKWPSLPLRRMIYETIRRMINYQVVDLVETSEENIKKLQPQSIDDIRQAAPLVKLSSTGFSRHKALKKFLKDSMYRHYRVHRMSLKASKIIHSLFEVFMNDTRVLPKDVQYRITTGASQSLLLAERLYDRAQELPQEKEIHQARMIADYIAGMTDRFAISEYEKLFNPLTLT